MKLTAVTHTASNSCHKVSACLSYSQGFHAWLACTPSERHRAVSWGRVHCYTLIPLQSVGVDADSRRFYANLANKDFAVLRCYSLWHANTTCTYLYSATSIPPLTQMSNVQVKSKLILNSYIMTLLINKILFSNSIEYTKCTFLYKYKVFLMQHVISNFVIKQLKTINKVEAESVLNCTLIKFYRIYEKHANIINWETGTGVWVVHTHTLTHTDHHHRTQNTLWHLERTSQPESCTNRLGDINKVPIYKSLKSLSIESKGNTAEFFYFFFCILLKINTYLMGALRNMCVPFQTRCEMLSRTSVCIACSVR